MERCLTLAALLATCAVVLVSSYPRNYWDERARILAEESFLSLGGELHFGPGERTTNDILMTAKYKEIDEDPSKFLPAKNFLTAVESIEESEVFKMIEKLPKGAVLHAHDTAIVSEDFVYNNITFSEDLYVCDVDGIISFRFFEVPNGDCDWELLSKLRENATIADDLNKRIRQQLTMVVSDPATAYPNVDAAWTAFMTIFITIEPLLTYRPIYEKHFYQGLQEFYDDNVLYLELRTTLPPLYELNGTQYNALEVVRIYKEVNDRFVRDHPNFIGTKLIYAPLRSATPEDFDEYLTTLASLKAMFPDFVAGFDLVGQEDKGEPLAVFADKLRKISDDIHLFFHAGETNWYGLTTDENLIDAVLLNTTRIGHGYALLKHPRALEMARSRDIAVEVNPISNQVLGLVEDMRNHPANVFFAQGFPVVISCDDPGLWGAKALSYDFYEAFMALMSRNADLRALKQLAINSIKYSTMSNSQKLKAFTIWKTQWANFVANLNIENNIVPQ